MPTGIHGLNDTPLLLPPEATLEANKDFPGDSLGTSKYARALADFVRSCSTPMTIGIQGEWGSGKSSLLNMMERVLNTERDADAHVDTFRFETWQHGAVGNDGVLGFLVLQHFVETMRERYGDDGKLAQIASKVLNVVAHVGKAAAAGTVNVATHGLLDGGTLVSMLQGGDSANGGVGLNVLKQNFAKLAKELAERNKKGSKGKPILGRSVVFIDDLDRVRPGRAVALLEILKNFMDVDHCVFVVACDYEVVRLGVKERFGIEDPVKVRAFFDKVIQVPFSMPVHSYRLGGLIHAFLDARDAPVRVTNMHAALADLVETALGTNPRAFKRFVNLVDLATCLEGDRDRVFSDPDQVVALFAVTSLCMRWEAIAGLLGRAAHGGDLPRMIEALLHASDADGNAGESIPAELREILDDAYKPDWNENDEFNALGDFLSKLVELQGRHALTEGSAGAMVPLARWFKAQSVSIEVPTVLSGRGGAWEHLTLLIRKVEGGERALKVADWLWNAANHMGVQGRLGARVTLVRQPTQIYATVAYDQGMATLWALSPRSGRMNINAQPAFAAKHPGLPNLASLGETFVEACRKAHIKFQENGRTGWTINFGDLPKDPTPVCDAIEHLLREAGKRVAAPGSGVICPRVV